MIYNLLTEREILSDRERLQHRRTSQHALRPPSMPIMVADIPHSNVLYKRVFLHQPTGAQASKPGPAWPMTYQHDAW